MHLLCKTQKMSQSLDGTRKRHSNLPQPGSNKPPDTDRRHYNSLTFSILGDIKYFVLNLVVQVMMQLIYFPSKTAGNNFLQHISFITVGRIMKRFNY